MIWPVIVVPTFAPRMTPIDWCSDITPAPTRPDVSTIVAVELWMTAVTTRPSRKPTSGLFVTFSIARLKASDEPFFQSVAHQAHAVQEQRQTAKEGDQVENRHKRFKPLLLYYAARRRFRAVKYPTLTRCYFYQVRAKLQSFSQDLLQTAKMIYPLHFLCARGTIFIDKKRRLSTMLNAGNPIGVMDSGIGGLTVVRELQRILPRRRYHLFWRQCQLPLRQQDL